MLHAIASPVKKLIRGKNVHNTQKPNQTNSILNYKDWQFLSISLTLFCLPLVSRAGLRSLEVESPKKHY